MIVSLNKRDMVLGFLLTFLVVGLTYQGFIALYAYEAVGFFR